MKLKGKAAIITGGGRGIGRAAAVEMAKEGASVAVISRTATELEETVRLIGGDAFSFTGDISNPGNVDALVEKTLAAFGRVDILMNNAAVRGPVAPIHEVEHKDWNGTLAVNLGGAYMLCRAVAPHMIRQGGGKIINVTSGLGEMVLPPLGVYSIAKAALNHMTRIMAEELKGLNIQVNAMDPGAVDTRMQEELRGLGPEALGEEAYKEFMALKESGYIEPPEKPARLAVFLASGDSDAITGEIGTIAEYMRLGYNPL
jgi:NAD(P)-dependent dehydrogenase (short-subunit alcohol dehydrogenase family)